MTTRIVLDFDNLSDHAAQSALIFLEQYINEKHGSLARMFHGGAVQQLKAVDPAENTKCQSKCDPDDPNIGSYNHFLGCPVWPHNQK